MASSKPEIATYVFMDLESTGLPGIGEKPRIVEISLVAVQCKLLQNCCKTTPRVLDKITVCLNPSNKPMTHTASLITGLYNDDVENLSKFDENTCKLLQIFLSRLPQPVCMLAHNGNKFDFPMLKAELDKINQSLPDDLLCADTLEGLQFVESVSFESKPYSGGRKNPSENEAKKQNGASEDLADEITPVRQTWNGGAFSKSSTNIPPPAPRKKRNFNEPRRGAIKLAKRKLLQDDEEQPRKLVNVQGDGGNPDVTIKRLAPRRLAFGDASGASNLEKNAAVTNDKEKTEDHNLSEDVELLSFPEELFLEDFNENTESNNSVGRMDLSENNSSRQLSEKSAFVPVSSAADTACHTYSTQSTPQRLTPLESKLNLMSKDAKNVANETTASRSMEPNSTNEMAVSRSLEPELTNEMAVSRSLEQTLVKENQCSKQTPSIKRKSFKLPDIYKRYFGRFPEISHAAEDDCLALLRIVQWCFEQFSPWVEENAKPFSEIPKMF